MLVAWILALAGVAWAHVAPVDREELPNFDLRVERAAKENATSATAAERPSAARLLARAEGEGALRRQVRGVAIERDPVTGAVTFVGATDEFLTREGGSGGAVSAARLATISTGEKHREVSAFLEEQRAVFGHGSEVLGGSRISRDYVTEHSGLRTTVWQQQVEAIDVFGATLQSHVTQRGELVNVASQLLPDAAAAVPTAFRGAKGFAAKTASGLSARQAVARMASSLGEPLEATGIVALNEAVGAEERQSFEAEGVQDASARRVWLPVGESQLVLCWEVVATIADRGEMFRVLVAADDGEILVRHCLTNYISDASYRVFTSDSPAPMSPGHATPSTAQPPTVSRTLVTTPALNTTASPNGWINDGGMETVGNNVDAHTDTNADDLADLPRPQATGAARVFDPPLDLTQAPSTYKDAAVVDLFYWCNVIHDRLYALGFTEAAGNFQTNNFGKGGLGNDAVQADAQDGSGTNNANFSTPPDGSAGRMQMYVFSYPTPNRDGDFDHEIVIHEYVHGLSNRLVGGGVGISSLQPRGMGEGWSDFYGLAFLSEPGDDVNANYAAGGYATKDLGGLTTNYYFGIRRYPYSTNLAINPLTFRDIDPSQANPHTGIPISPIIGNTANEVHNIGEVWCVTLWDARANLITKHGYATGNQLILQLVTDGMKLAPANPNFLQARDAIVQADLVLTGGANRNELWSAFAKRGMGFGATSPSSSTSTGVVESYAMPDDLSVTPTGLVSATGSTGGPFTPSSTTYTLTNNGAAPLNWTATDSVAWIDVAPAAGTLAPGASTSLTVSFTSAAAALTVGQYSSVITVNNTTSGITHSRSFSLEVTPFSELIYAENFESGVLDAAKWTVTGTGTYRTLVNTSWVPHGGARHLTMESSDSTGATYARNEATLTLDLAGRTGVQLVFWAKMWDDDPNPPPASPFTGGADFDGVAISVNGTQWYEVQSLRSPTITNSWSKFTVDLDAALATYGLSYNANFRIRFNQYDNFNITTDGIAIDDLVVQRVYTRRVQTNLPASLGENSGTTPFTVTAMPAPATDLVVALNSTVPGTLAVPASVIIPAGQSSVSANATVTNDALLNGTRLVQVAASASGWGGGSQTVSVIDDETGVLTLTVPSPGTEGGSAMGSVSCSAVVDQAVSVTLASSFPTVAAAPATVVIPAGQSSVSFTVNFPENTRIDPDLSATLTASVAGWTSGSATVLVTDNESRQIGLLVPASVREGDTGRTGTVSIAGVMTSPLVVALSSSDTTELTVPASVTIPAGQTQTTFALIVVNDPDFDGAQVVTVGATATGFVSTSQPVSVADNDAHHFRISPIASPQLRNQPFAVTVTAEDATNATITNFASSVMLSAASGGSAVTMSPTTISTWTNGVWSGNVTISATATGVVITAGAGGVTGSSNPFDVGVGVPHHFTWAPVASPQAVDTPFVATLTARDAVENIVDFSGPASLFVRSSTTLPAIGTGISYATTPLMAQYPSSRTETIYLASELGGARQFTGFQLTVDSLGTSPLQNLTVRIKPTTLTGFAGVQWDNTGWTTVYQSPSTPVTSGAFTIPFTAPFNYDGTSNLRVEISFRNAVSGSSHYCRYTSTAEARTMWGAGTTSVDPLSWSGTTGHSTGGTQLRFANIQWLAAPALCPVRPATAATFVGGTWTGAISVPVVDSNLTLVAQAPSGGGTLEGASALFSVVNSAAVATPEGTVFSEDFESGVLSSAWTVTGTTTYRTIVTTANLPHGGLRHLTMDSSDSSASAYARNEATVTLDLAGRTGVQLQFWAKMWDDDPHGPPTAPFTGGADFDGVAISANGTQWYEVQPLRSPTITNEWSKFTVNLDAAIATYGLSYGSTFKIRFNQYDNFNITTDGIAIDDLVVLANPQGSAASLSLPATLVEGTAGATGTLTLAAPAAAPVTFTLVSSRPAKLAVPATVLVPTGQISVSFPLTLPDDDLLDGSRTATVRASAPAYVSGTADTVVTDNETVAATLTLPTGAREGDGIVAGQLTLDRVSAGAITFTSTSSLPSVATVPPSVLVPPGFSGTKFPIVVVDDNVIEGTQTTQIDLSRTGAPTLSQVLTILDNENTQLVVTVPTQGVEGTTANGTVTLSGVLSSPLVVNLTSDRTSRVTVPASVTIPTGSTSATFTLSYVDNPLLDGSQPALITANATGFITGSATTQAIDNDPHHFTFASIASPQVKGAPFTVTITARDAADAVLTTFTGPATLTSAGATVTPGTLTGWTAGVWTGSVTVNSFGSGLTLSVDDGFGHTGVSNAFDIGSGALNRFVWDPISSPKPIDTPFTTTIRAVDVGQNPVAYSGTAALSLLLPELVNTAVGTSDTMTYPMNGGSTVASRAMVIYPAAELGGAGRITSLALSVSSAPGALNNWTIRLKTTALSAFASATWDNTGWTTVHVSNANVTSSGWSTFTFSTPFDYDGTSNLMVDFTYANPASISGYGYVNSSYLSTSTRAVVGATGTLGTNPLTWTTESTHSRFLYTRVPLLQLSIARAVPITPSSTTAFVGGVWTGQVTVPANTSAGVLLAEAPGSVRGYSNSFATVAGTPTSEFLVFAEDWESGAINPAWTLSTGTYVRTRVTGEYRPHDSGYHLTMDSNTSGYPSRNEVTTSVNLTNRKKVELSFWAKTWGGSSTVPSSPFTNGADFDGVAISTNGTTWYEVQPLRTSNFASNDLWTRFVVDLDAAITARGLTYGSVFRIRFNHYWFYTIPSAGLAIDDVRVSADFETALQVTLPASANEDAGPVTAMVQLTAPQPVDTTVALVSSAPGKLTVPASVVVPAGQLTANFPVTLLDNTLLDGERLVSVVATAAGSNPGHAEIRILDNETGTLSLTVPASAAETATVITGTVSLAAPASGNLVVALTSSDPTAATVPATVTINAGSKFATFPISVVNDTKIDGTQNTTITATIPGWTPTSGVFAVTDNETTVLSVSAYSVEEGDTGTGTITISGTLPAPLVISLGNSQPTRVNVPTSVTIPAGATSGTFNYTAIENTLTEGSATATVSATATGFTTGTGSFTVIDDDLYSFSVSVSLSSPQLANQSFYTYGYARNFSGSTISYTGPATLTAKTSGGTVLPCVPSTVNFSGGYWSGTVTVQAPGTGVTMNLSDGTGHTGVSTSFDLVVGALDHFGFGAIASPQLVGIPSNVSILAQDTANNTVTSFTGMANLALVEREKVTGTDTGQYVFPIPSGAQSRYQVIYTPAQLGAAGTIHGLAFQMTNFNGTSSTFTIRIKPTALTTYSILAWESTGWTTVYSGPLSFRTGWVYIPFSTPFAHDGVTNLMFDFCSDSPTSISASGVASSPSGTRALWLGGTGYANSTTWSGSTPAPGSSNGVLNLRLIYRSTVGVSPAATTAFVNGSWTGPVSFADRIPNGYLQATSGTVMSLSSAFYVARPSTLSVSAGNWIVSGLQGGPFAPASSTLTLGNTGEVGMNWSGTGPSWLSLSPPNGFIPAGGNALVAIQPNAATAALPAGLFNANVALTNQTHGLGNTTRNVDLVIASPGGDSDGDGIPDLAEFAMGMNPTLFDSAGRPAVVPMPDPALGLTFRYRRLKNPGNLRYTIEYSADLSNWQTETAIEPVSVTPNADGLTETVVVRLLSSVPLGDVPARFLHLKIDVQ